MAITASTLLHDLQQLQHTKPLVHNITNYVAMTTCANVLLALSASPLMAHAPEELSDIVNISQALVLNIGTLDSNWIESMLQAQAHAQQQQLPIVLDPVGAGASELRTKTALDLLQRGVTVVRGNASEIMALNHADIHSRGVDSSHDSSDAVSAAKQLATTFDCVVAISGAEDIIINSNQQWHCHHGSPRFTQVTAMGCALSSVIGAFLAINADALKATVHAMLSFSLAGEQAAQTANGPGSFYVNLLDNLANLHANNLTDITCEQH